MKAKYFRAEYWNGEYLIINKKDNRCKVIFRSKGLWPGYEGSTLEARYIDAWSSEWKEISKIEAFMEMI